MFRFHMTISRCISRGSNAQTVSGFVSCGIESCINSPGRITEESGLHKRKAWVHLADGWDPGDGEDPLMIICLLARQTATSLVTMNGLPTRTSRAFSWKCVWPLVMTHQTAPTTSRGVTPSVCLI